MNAAKACPGLSEVELPDEFDELLPEVGATPICERAWLIAAKRPPLPTPPALLPELLSPSAFCQTGFVVLVAYCWLI
jgi:hypothetical protein